jgi:hypothetical protein
LEFDTFDFACTPGLEILGDIDDFGDDCVVFAMIIEV